MKQTTACSIENRAVSIIVLGRLTHSQIQHMDVFSVLYLVEAVTFISKFTRLVFIILKVRVSKRCATAISVYEAK